MQSDLSPQSAPAPLADCSDHSVAGSGPSQPDATVQEQPQKPEYWTQCLGCFSWTCIPHLADEIQCSNEACSLLVVRRLCVQAMETLFPVLNYQHFIFATFIDCSVSEPVTVPLPFGLHVAFWGSRIATLDMQPQCAAPEAAVHLLLLYVLTSTDVSSCLRSAMACHAW